MRKGLFIVLDGNDGSGKATQAELLRLHFERKGNEVEKIDFPSYSKNFFGALIGECLAGNHGDFVNLDPKIASALYAADRYESAPAIRTALECGRVVIADRYASANQIHQGGKIEDENARVKFLAWLDRMEHEVFGIPRPDAIIYLRVPLSTSLMLLEEKRALKNGTLAEGERDTVEQDRRYLERSIAAAEWLLATQGSWHAVDCMQGEELRAREDISEEIVRIVETLRRP